MAHSMGLGKTLQVISFVDIFLRHTSATKVLCIVPINTIQNWLVEFNMWLPSKPGLISDSNGMIVEAHDSNKVRYRNFEVHLLSDGQRSTLSRAKVIGEWNKQGGVLLMGYELYRLLATVTPSMSSRRGMPPSKKKKVTTSDKANGEPEVIDLDKEEKHMELLIGIQQALCNPGADLVICDEGHRIKNDNSNISQALKRIHTRRRVVLTGYPLQNNLQEYWCMVDFVRPNFLGTKQEFCNMFERPILNGQCTDSTPSDVRLMRYRAHVLHSLLEGFVQRRSQSVLTKCLPSKEEHIILVNLSSIQTELYNTFVACLLNSVGYVNPIKGFHICTKIWNHPDILYCSLDMKSDIRTESPLTILDEASGSLQNSKSADRVVLPSSSSATSSNQHENSNSVKMNLLNQLIGARQLPSTSTTTVSAQAVLRTTVQMRQMMACQQSGQTVIVSTTQASENTTECSAPVVEPAALINDHSSTVVAEDDDMMWAKNVLKDYQTGVMENGGKLVILMQIIEESLKLGEKVLIFSQSLSTLSVIEEFLSKREVPFFPGRITDPQKPSRWAKSKSYFRLDGHTSAQERERLINRFNAPENTDVLLFMLSTRAGCLGINLIGASRVVVFDASWNPCHDVQAICRVYRYGQVKPVHIYRLISTGTMEKKIYDRQISKQGMANRIVDELNPEANFTKQEIMKLICEKEPVSPAADVAAAADQFSDPVLVRLCRNCSRCMSKVPFKHESLLADKEEQKLTKAEKREAKRGYEMEKRLAMQQHSTRAYCPGVIQPLHTRTTQPYVPKPVHLVGQDRNIQQPSTSTANGSLRQSSQSLPSHSLNLPIPLASVIRAGFPVTHWGQTMPVALLNSTCVPASAVPTADSCKSKNEVVTIDLDELPSPTKTLHQTAQGRENQENFTDLVTMARQAFPSVSPALVGLLSNQDEASKASQTNASNFQASSGPLTAETQSKHKNEKISDDAINSRTNSESTSENTQTSRGLLDKCSSPNKIPVDSTSPAHPVLQNVEPVAEKPNTSLSRAALIVQDGIISENQPNQEKANELSSLTPPTVQDGKNFDESVVKPDDRK
ncbi:helicase ARIP4-like isoform X1 [Montipora capricornis]